MKLIAEFGQAPSRVYALNGFMCIVPTSSKCWVALFISHLISHKNAI